jgi:hypothetical protein
MKTFFLTLILFCLNSLICFLQQGHWTKVGDIPEIRYAQTVNEINGKIYLVGRTNTMEVYDVTGNQIATLVNTQKSLGDYIV